MTEFSSRSRGVTYPESDGQPMTESDATRDYLLYCVEVLESHFAGRRNVYVSGNLFIYYQEGNPKAALSPDVFVIFGVSKRKRRSYKAWQEGCKLPSFILEVTSLSTRKQDELDKPQLYASLGVEEYFQYDPTGDYLQPQLKGQRLINGEYHPLPIEQTSVGHPGIHSQVLGLDLCLQPLSPENLIVPQTVPLPLALRFYDRQTGAKLLSYQELEAAREQAEAARVQAELALEQERLRSEKLRERLLALGIDLTDLELDTQDDRAPEDLT